MKWQNVRVLSDKERHIELNLCLGYGIIGFIAVLIALVTLA